MSTGSVYNNNNNSNTNSKSEILVGSMDNEGESVGGEILTKALVNFTE